MREVNKQRGGTASMIVSSVCNEHRNSDLRADNPSILRAFNERFELLESQRDDLLEALKEAVELYESSGLIANSPSCGRWVNKSRDAIAKAEGRE